jgi:hypothetical protein
MNDYTMSLSKNKSLTYPLERLELRSIIIFASRTLPAWEKNSSSSLDSRRTES